MLRKTPLVTVVPPIEAQAYRAASYVCVRYPPTGSGGDTKPPDPPVPPGAVVPPIGTPIVLEDEYSEGRYNSYTGVAPAPPGFVCRQEVSWITNLNDPMHDTQMYYYTCTRELP